MVNIGLLVAERLVSCFDRQPSRRQPQAVMQISRRASESSNFRKISHQFASTMRKNCDAEGTELSGGSAKVRSSAAQRMAAQEQGKAMRFLIRVAFWLSIVVLLLPTGSVEQATPGPQIGTVEAFSAAGAAVSDMRQFCSRQPDACTVGSQAAAAFGQKAQASAKMIYNFFTEKLRQDAAGSSEKTAGADMARNLQNTLMPADRSPAWRGPQPHPEQFAHAQRK